MKKIVLIIAIFFLAIEAFGQSARDMYNRYSDEEGVTAVYISPAMFRMIGKLPDMNMEAADGGNVDLSPIVRKLSGFYLLEVDNGPVADKLYAEVKKLVLGKKYELLMEVKDDGDLTRIYSIGGEKTVSAVVLTTKDEESFTFMSLEGNMDREQLENILAESAK